MRKSMDFEKLIGEGENAKGFTAQTANGTAKWRGTGWNKGCRGGWAAQTGCDYTMEQVEPDATRPTGRSNRTGE